MQKTLRLQIVLLAFIFCIAFGTFSPLILSGITSSGHSIPSDDILTDYFTGILWAVLIGLGILFSWLDLGEKTALLSVWACKCVVTLGAMLFYENAYSLDAYYYFHIASQPAYQWKNLTFGQGTEGMIALAWILEHWLKVGLSYHALKVIFSFIGLMGVFLFYLGISDVVGYRSSKNIYLLCLFPSVLFWSSILGKDPIGLLGMGLYFYGVTKWYSRNHSSYLMSALIGLFIASATRSWYLPILLIPFALLLARSWRRVKSFGKVSLTIIGLGLGGISLVVFPFIISTFHATDLRHVILVTNAVSHSWSVGGSAISEIPKFTTFGSMLAFVPYGAFTALFRPLPGELSSGFGFLAGLENLILIVLLIKYVFGSRRSGWLKSPLSTWLFALIFSWSLVYCFISPQNLGSAVRFKLQILPVLLSLIILGKNEKELAKCAE